VTNRVVDYCGFAVRFIGLGYLVLWPLARPDPLGLAGLCRSGALWRAARFLCHWPQFVTLTPGLHLLGILCVGWLAIWILWRQGVRFRRAHAARADAALALSTRIAVVPGRPAFVAPLPKVKPRSQFGLRGGPRGKDDSGIVSSASAAKTLAQQD